MTTDKLYLGLQPIYLYGCNSCGKMGTFLEDTGFARNAAEMQKYSSTEMENLEVLSKGPLLARVPKMKNHAKGESEENSTTEI